MRWINRILFTMSVLAAPASAQSGVSDRPQPHANDTDFDFLLGDWRFTIRHAEFGNGAGYWTAVRLATGDGSHILDEYRIVDEDGVSYYASTTLRVLNTHADVWELVSAEPGSGLQNTGTARKMGDEMHIEQRFGVASGSPEVWRIRYHDIRPDGFSWVADRSADGGVTWERGYMTIEARRIGPARELAPLTRSPAAVSR